MPSRFASRRHGRSCTSTSWKTKPPPCRCTSRPGSAPAGRNSRTRTPSASRSTTSATSSGGSSSASGAVGVAGRRDVVPVGPHRGQVCGRLDGCSGLWMQRHGPTLENPPVAAFGWTVLALVFLDELLAMAGLGVYGWSTSARVAARLAAAAARHARVVLLRLAQGALRLPRRAPAREGARLRPRLASACGRPATTPSPWRCSSSRWSSTRSRYCSASGNRGSSSPADSAG